MEPKSSPVGLPSMLLIFVLTLVTALRTISATVSEPKLVQYDHWGQRIDDLQTSEGWRRMKAKMQEEGAVGIPFERKYAEYSRVLAFGKMFLATGDAHVVSVLLAPLGISE